MGNSEDFAMQLLKDLEMAKDSQNRISNFWLELEDRYTLMGYVDIVTGIPLKKIPLIRQDIISDLTYKHFSENTTFPTYTMDELGIKDFNGTIEIAVPKIIFLYHKKKMYLCDVNIDVMITRLIEVV